MHHASLLVLAAPTWGGFFAAGRVHASIPLVHVFMYETGDLVLGGRGCPVCRNLLARALRALTRGKEAKIQASKKGPGNPEPVEDEPVPGDVPVAERGADVPRNAEPGWYA